MKTFSAMGLKPQDQEKGKEKKKEGQEKEKKNERGKEEKKDKKNKVLFVQKNAIAEKAKEKEKRNLLKKHHPLPVQKMRHLPLLPSL